MADLAAFRRAQTPADRNLKLLRALVRLAATWHGLTVDLFEVRRVGARFRAEVELVPVSTTTAARSCSSIRAHSCGAAKRSRRSRTKECRPEARPRDGRASGIGLGFYIDGEFGCCATPQEILSGWVLAQTPFHSGAPGLPGPGVKLLAVVPDDVSRVWFSSPSGLRLSAIVRGNVAAAEMPPHAGRSYSDAGTRMTWYDAAGRRIGP